MPIDPTELAAAIADAIGRGAIPGLGAAQNDGWPHDEDVDATHPLNLRYVIPSNSQRVVAAKLSFHLAAFRTYTAVVNNTAVSSAASSASSSGASSASSSSTSGTTTTLNYDFGIHTHGQTLGGGFGDTDPTDLGLHQHGITHSHPIPHTHNIDHTHSVTSNVSLTPGVLEGTTAAGVTIKFDGVDKTALLGGPWSVDVVELDVTQYIQRLPDKTYHTIALTPTGNGRIEAHLRLNYFANAGIPA